MTAACAVAARVMQRTDPAPRGRAGRSSRPAVGGALRPRVSRALTYTRSRCALWLRAVDAGRALGSSSYASSSRNRAFLSSSPRSARRLRRRAPLDLARDGGVGQRTSGDDETSEIVTSSPRSARWSPPLAMKFGATLRAAAESARLHAYTPTASSGRDELKAPALRQPALPGPAEFLGGRRGVGDDFRRRAPRETTITDDDATTTAHGGDEGVDRHRLSPLLRRDDGQRATSESVHAARGRVAARLPAGGGLHRRADGGARGSVHLAPPRRRAEDRLRTRPHLLLRPAQQERGPVRARPPVLEGVLAGARRQERRRNHRGAGADQGDRG